MYKFFNFTLNNIDYLLESDGNDDNYIFLLKSPCLNNQVNRYSLSWHVPLVKKYDASVFDKGS